MTRMYHLPRDRTTPSCRLMVTSDFRGTRQTNGSFSARQAPEKIQRHWDQLLLLSRYGNDPTKPAAITSRWLCSSCDTFCRGKVSLAPVSVTCSARGHGSIGRSHDDWGDIAEASAICSRGNAPLFIRHARWCLTRGAQCDSHAWAMAWQTVTLGAEWEEGTQA